MPPPLRPFQALLTDSERGSLERIRADRGLRSSADALRILIRENDPAEDFTTPAKVEATMRILPMSPPPSPAATFGYVRPAPGAMLKGKGRKGA